MNSWQATALNTAPDSENQIHSDELAKEYGFKGGLVPVSYTHLRAHET